MLGDGRRQTDSPGTPDARPSNHDKGTVRAHQGGRGWLEPCATPAEPCCTLGQASGFSHGPRKQAPKPQRPVPTSVSVSGESPRRRGDVRTCPLRSMSPPTAGAHRRRGEARASPAGRGRRGVASRRGAPRAPEAAGSWERGREQSPQTEAPRRHRHPRRPGPAPCGGRVCPCGPCGSRAAGQRESLRVRVGNHPV